MHKVVKSLRTEGTSFEGGLELLDACIDDIAYARTLLSSGNRNFNWKDAESANSLLHILCYSDMADQVKLLLEYGADPDIKNKNLEAPLHWCAKLNSVKSAKMLLTHRSSVDVTDNSLSTPLHLASAAGNLEMVPLLLDHGASVQVLDMDGLTALEVAAVGKTATAFATTVLLLRHYQQLNLNVPKHIRQKYRGAIAPSLLLETLKRAPPPAVEMTPQKTPSLAVLEERLPVSLQQGGSDVGTAAAGSGGKDQEQEKEEAEAAAVDGANRIVDSEDAAALNPSKGTTSRTNQDASEEAIAARMAELEAALRYLEEQKNQSPPPVVTITTIYDLMQTGRLGGGGLGGGGIFVPSATQRRRSSTTAIVASPARVGETLEERTGADGLTIATNTSSRKGSVLGFTGRSRSPSMLHNNNNNDNKNAPPLFAVRRVTRNDGKHNDASTSTSSSTGAGEGGTMMMMMMSGGSSRRGSTMPPATPAAAAGFSSKNSMRRSSKMANPQSNEEGLFAMSGQHLESHQAAQALKARNASHHATSLLDEHSSAGAEVHHHGTTSAADLHHHNSLTHSNSSNHSHSGAAVNNGDLHSPYGSFSRKTPPHSALRFPPAECIPILFSPVVTTTSIGRNNDAVRDEEHTRYLDVILAIEHCADCEEHNGQSLRHDAVKYAKLAQEVQFLVIQAINDADLAVRLFAMRTKPLDHSRLGAFEVSIAVNVTPPLRKRAVVHEHFDNGHTSRFGKKSHKAKITHTSSHHSSVDVLSDGAHLTADGGEAKGGGGGEVPSVSETAADGGAFGGGGGAGGGGGVGADPTLPSGGHLSKASAAIAAYARAKPLPTGWVTHSLHSKLQSKIFPVPSTVAEAAMTFLTTTLQETEKLFERTHAAATAARRNKIGLATTGAADEAWLDYLISQDHPHMHFDLQDATRWRYKRDATPTRSYLHALQTSYQDWTHRMKIPPRIEQSPLNASAPETLFSPHSKAAEVLDQQLVHSVDSEGNLSDKLEREQHQGVSAVSSNDECGFEEESGGGGIVADPRRKLSNRVPSDSRPIFTSSAVAADHHQKHSHHHQHHHAHHHHQNTQSHEQAHSSVDLMEHAVGPYLDLQLAHRLSTNLQAFEGKVMKHFLVFDASTGVNHHHHHHHHHHHGQDGHHHH